MAGGTPGGAGQDKWPSAPSRSLPYPPGNDTDAVLRLVAEGMSKRPGVPVQVINKPGGGGVVGFGEMLWAKPGRLHHRHLDARTGDPQIVAGNTPYKIGDYVSVAGLHANDFVLAARGNIPANNLKGIRRLGQKKQGKPVIVGSYAPAAVPR